MADPLADRSPVCVACSGHNPGNLAINLPKIVDTDGKVLQDGYLFICSYCCSASVSQMLEDMSATIAELSKPKIIQPPGKLLTNPQGQVIRTGEGPKPA